MRARDRAERRERREREQSSGVRANGRHVDVVRTARLAPRLLTPGDVLHLQRAAGNGAVGGVLDHAPDLVVQRTIIVENGDGAGVYGASRAEEFKTTFKSDLRNMMSELVGIVGTTTTLDAILAQPRTST